MVVVLGPTKNIMQKKVCHTVLLFLPQRTKVRKIPWNHRFPDLTLFALDYLYRSDTLGACRGGLEVQSCSFRISVPPIPPELEVVADGVFGVWDGGCGGIGIWYLDISKGIAIEPRGVSYSCL